MTHRRPLLLDYRSGGIVSEMDSVSVAMTTKVLAADPLQAADEGSHEEGQGLLVVLLRIQRESGM